MRNPPTTTTLTTCRRCGAPVITDHSDTHPIHADLPNHTPEHEARAWLTGTRTYLVHTATTRQWLTWRNPSPHAIAQLITEGA